jgi:hypothetical protein
MLGMLSVAITSKNISSMASWNRTEIVDPKRTISVTNCQNFSIPLSLTAPLSQPNFSFGCDWCNLKEKANSVCTKRTLRRMKTSQFHEKSQASFLKWAANNLKARSHYKKNVRQTDQKDKLFRETLTQFTKIPVQHRSLALVKSSKHSAHELQSFKPSGTSA